MVIIHGSWEQGRTGPLLSTLSPLHAIIADKSHTEVHVIWPGGLPRFKERALVCRLTRSSVCPAMYKRLAIVRLPIFLFPHASSFAVAAAFADSLRFLLPPVFAEPIATTRAVSPQPYELLTTSQYLCGLFDVSSRCFHQRRHRCPI